MAFKIGDRVHVEFDGTVDESIIYGWTVIQDESGLSHQLWTTGIDRLARLSDPENWPPRIGDVWEAKGTEYFARSHSIHATRPVMHPVAGGDCYYDATTVYRTRTMDAFKALGPKLLRRRTV